MNTLRLLCIFLGIFSLLSHVAQADLYVQQRQKTDSFSIMGKTNPAKEVIIESWVSEEALLTNMGDSGFLIKHNGEMFMFDHIAKTYTTMNMDPGKMMQEKEMAPEEAAHFKKFMSKMMEIKIHIEPSNETKTINGYDCSRYNQTMEMSMGTNNSIIWATTDIDVDSDMYTRFTASTLASQPGMKQSKDMFIREMNKIKGVHVFTETSSDMMGQDMKSTIELLQIQETQAPPGTFEVPKGYRKKSPGF